MITQQARRVDCDPLSMVSALCLIVAGAIGLFYLLVHSYGEFGWVLTAPVALIVIGPIWLYFTLTSMP
jgi:hypothetical protein